MKQATIFEILKTLEQAKVPFTLARDRPDSIRVDATFVGLRVEIDCFDDNHVEISTFRGDEDIEGGYDYLLELMRQHADA